MVSWGSDASILDRTSVPESIVIKRLDCIYKLLRREALGISAG